MSQQESSQIQLNAVVQAAIADADALSAVYGQVFADRIAQNISALGANFTQQLAASHLATSQGIVNQLAATYAAQAVEQASQIEIQPLERIRLSVPTVEAVDPVSLLPKPKPVKRLSIA